MTIEQWVKSYIQRKCPHIKFVDANHPELGSYEARSWYALSERGFDRATFGIGFMHINIMHITSVEADSYGVQLKYRVGL